MKRSYESFAFEEVSFRVSFENRRGSVLVLLLNESHVTISLMQYFLLNHFSSEIYSTLRSEMNLCGHLVCVES